MQEIRVCEMDSGACAMMSLSLVCLIEGGPQMVLYPNRRIYVSEKYISGLFGSENILNPSLIVCLKHDFCNHALQVGRPANKDVIFMFFDASINDMVLLVW